MITAVQPSASQYEDGRSASMRELIPALDRALKIPTLMESSPQRAYSATELSRLVDILKSSVFNICGAMVGRRT